MPKTHELKCWPEFFRAVKSGEKTAEVRYNDRDYQVGDLILLRIYYPDICISGTGSECTLTVTITHIAHFSRIPNMPKNAHDWCLISFKREAA